MNPIVLGILGVLVLVTILLSFFMLGKILGVALVVGAMIGLSRGMDPKWVFAIAVLGVFVFWNPFEFATLQLIR